MKKITNEWPDFEATRAAFFDGVEYPVEASFNEEGYQDTLKKLERICGLSEHIRAVYSKALKTGAGFDDFKSKVLALLDPSVNEDALERTIRIRWLEENKVTITVKGAKSHQGNTLEMLLDITQFPPELDKFVGELKAVRKEIAWTRLTFRFKDLFDHDAQKFTVTSDAKARAKEQNTVYARNYEELAEHYNARQLADALNALSRMGAGIGAFQTLPIPLEKIMDSTYPADIHGVRVFAAKPIRYKAIEVPNVKIISITDENDYEQLGEKGFRFEPVIFEAEVNGMPGTYQIKNPKVIMRGFSKRIDNTVTAKEIMEDPAIIAHLLAIGSGTIKKIEAQMA